MYESQSVRWIFSCTKSPPLYHDLNSRKEMIFFLNEVIKFPKNIQETFKRRSKPSKNSSALFTISSPNALPDPGINYLQLLIC